LIVLSVASEMFPLVKTGGLADVTGALPHALRPWGVEIHTLLPGYPAVLAQLPTAEPCWQEAAYFGGPARILRAEGLLVLDAPHLYDRPGNPYTGPDGQDWPDNPLRFGALAYAAALIGQGALPGLAPDLVHAHDWQTGLAPAYLHFAGARAASVFTVHNLAFQGQVPATLLGALRLPASAYSTEGLEYYQSIGMLKAGLRYADRITTVSPSYAAEICTPEGGMGLDGVLRARGEELRGILNGIDISVWNPATDPLLPAPFSAKALAGRRASKAALQLHFGLEAAPDTQLFGVVSRLTHQKGLDLLLPCLDQILANGAQLAILGAGDAALQQAFQRAAQAHPGRIGVSFGYDERLAHRMQAGSDVILVPSRFEPCGLTQLCALRYGAIPLVSRVGGLADTVIDANEAARNAGVATGFVFAPVSAQALSLALGRALTLWRDQAGWRRLQKSAMASDVSWAMPARRYAALYAEARAGKDVLF
jgi:starch synthase